MRAPNSQLIVVSFVSALSIGVAWAAESGVKAEGSRASLGHRMAAFPSQRKPARKKRTFKYVDHTCESGCIENYESSDGQEVSLTLACWTSTARETRQEMRRMIREGSVVQRGWRDYGHGRRRRPGERTVATYPRDESGEKPAKIFWYVEGSCFSFIEAGSLQLALEFERSDAFAEAVSW